MKMKLLKIGNNLTVMTDDGSIITTNNCTDELFQRVHSLYEQGDIESIKRLLVPELSNEEARFAAKKEMVATINDLASEYPNLFKVNGTALYRTGIELSIPEDLAIEYVQAYNQFKKQDFNFDTLENFKAFKSLDNFWMWCALNPNPASREDLFRFLKHHGMPITSQGMFLAYRRVVSLNQTAAKDLIEFVSNSYVKVKTIWRMDPANYYVISKNGQYHIAPVVDGDVVGKLDRLYDELSNQEQQFTDNHTRSMDYRIGVEARIERHEGNQSNQVSCSRGLHVASKAYDYSGFGDTPILVVVNPMDVLAVPQGEDGKLRTCAFTPIAVLEDNDENSLLDSSDFDGSDILLDHFADQVVMLKDMVARSSVYELNVNHILGVSSSAAFSSIFHNLANAESVVKKRLDFIWEEEESDRESYSYDEDDDYCDDCADGNHCEEHSF
jgi:hypothetical protein